MLQRHTSSEIDKKTSSQNGSSAFPCFFGCANTRHTTNTIETTKLALVWVVGSWECDSFKRFTKKNSSPPTIHTIPSTVITSKNEQKSSPPPTIHNLPSQKRIKTCCNQTNQPNQPTLDSQPTPSPNLLSSGAGSWVLCSNHRVTRENPGSKGKTNSFPTVDSNQKSGINWPVEGKVVFQSFFFQGFYIHHPNGGDRVGDSEKPSTTYDRSVGMVTCEESYSWSPVGCT